jgi:enoyl-CoA hydratase/carnithine racemase
VTQTVLSKREGPVGLTRHRRDLAEPPDVAMRELARAAESDCGAVLISSWTGTALSLEHQPYSITDAVAALRSHRGPTIVVYDGSVTGTDLELALFFDLRIAGSTARVGWPRMRHGELSRVGAIRRLVDLVGESLAARLALLGEVLAADDPGLARLHTVVAADQLDEHIGQLAERLCASAPWALEAIKTATTLASETPLGPGAMVEAGLASLLLGTSDRLEGLAAFGEGRRPQFRGGEER